MTIALLRNPIQHYDWGSHTAIAELQGRPASEQPEAELWMGGYPELTSDVLLNDEWVPLSNHLDLFLTSSLVARFGTRLPFLMKYLAIARPLSIQSHPDTINASAGFKVGAFKDPYAKPEMVYALSPIEMLCGFRPKNEVTRFLSSLGRADLADLLKTISVGELFAQQIHTPELVEGLRISNDVERDVPWLSRLVSAHPHDPAAVAPLFINHVALKAGEALFVPAGQVHCYLNGFGVEVMGASDNVVRAGLTSKVVDIDQFVANVDLESTEPAIITAKESDGWQVWQPSVSEFGLAKTTTSTTATGLGIIACTAGSFTATSDGVTLQLNQGDSLIASADSRVELVGSGELFRSFLPN